MKLTEALQAKLPHPPAHLVTAFARSARTDRYTAASAIRAGILNVAAQIAPALDDEAALINAVADVVASHEFAFHAVAAAATDVARDRFEHPVSAA